MPAPVLITGNPVSPRVQRILAEVCRAAGISGCRVSSTQRTPAEQAAAMYGLCIRQGLDAVYRLYKAPGRAVVGVYEAEVIKGAPRAEVIAAMTAKIEELGPERVSRHCSTKFDVIDVSPLSIPEDRLAAFVSAAEAHGEISRVLSPITEPRDPEAIHIEIERHDEDVSS